MDDLDNNISKLRKQRHDFMNDLQVLYGYLQLGKVDHALNHIKDLSYKNSLISSLYTLGNERFACIMEANIQRCWDNELEVALYIEIEELPFNIFQNEYCKKEKIINEVFDRAIENQANKIFINIYEDSSGINIILSNIEEYYDYFSFEDLDTENINKDENIIKYSYENNNNLCYRLIINDNRRNTKLCL